MATEFYSPAVQAQPTHSHRSGIADKTLDAMMVAVLFTGTVAGWVHKLLAIGFQLGQRDVALRVMRWRD
jgi:hypothetical protein